MWFLDFTTQMLIRVMFIHDEVGLFLLDDISSVVIIYKICRTIISVVEIFYFSTQANMYITWIWPEEYG